MLFGRTREISEFRASFVQVNAVADSGSAAAPLSGIDKHSRPPWQVPPSSLLLCSACYKPVQYSNHIRKDCIDGVELVHYLLGV